MCSNQKRAFVSSGLYDIESNTRRKEKRKKEANEAHTISHKNEEWRTGGEQNYEREWEELWNKIVIYTYICFGCLAAFSKREREEKRENFPPSSSLFYAAAASTLDGFSMLCHEEREPNYAQLYAVWYESGAMLNVGNCSTPLAGIVGLVVQECVNIIHCCDWFIPHSSILL